MIPPREGVLKVALYPDEVPAARKPERAAVDVEC